ncbi:MAG: hypothetical protein O7D31_10500 [Alphaproteobacteria bacterium]|nr:hypothetical protein [Alphaproteobacteria bacterium]
MHDDDKFLRSIPAFLRRIQEPPPRKLPVRPRDLPAARNRSEPRLQPAAAPAPKPAAPAAPAAPKVVELAPPSAAEASAAQRARIALAFENQDLAENPDLTEGKDREDITFRVTLPRGVARQICMLAVARDTTQRAVVLRALRLAGLSVPDGCDIDLPNRPDRGAKRQA